jgi:hypothetical protein
MNRGCPSARYFIETRADCCQVVMLSWLLTTKQPDNNDNILSLKTY